jgi:hypothetical protein
MALVVETGAGLADSDSYISLADARTMAAKYGVTLPTLDADAEVALRQGAQYVDLQEPGFCGSRLVDTQYMAWPRTETVNSYGQTIAAGAMPKQLGMAQVYAAAEYGAGTDVRANDDGKSVASEAVTGAVSVSYFNNGKTGSTVTITKCLDALRPLLVCASNGFEFRVSRG